jgi:hypothetical protein
MNPASINIFWFCLKELEKSCCAEKMTPKSKAERITDEVSPGKASK